MKKVVDKASINLKLKAKDDKYKEEIINANNGIKP
jgi:hypothetical protein